MSDFGLLNSGLVIKRYADIQSDLNAFYTALYGNPNLNGDSVIGRRIAAQSKLLADLWELYQVVYNAPFIALTDEGSIDNTLANEGITRKAALPTIINKGICTFYKACTLPAGALIADSNGDQFALANTYTAGGAGTATLEFICTVTGATVIPPGDFASMSIVSPVDGWTAVTISSDSDAITLGRDIETLAEARIRYTESLGLPGAGTIPALIANLNNLSGVSARILENVTMATDGNGLPPKSMSIIVRGTASDAEKALIGATIWAKRPGGIQLNGTTSVSIIDSNGDTQTVNYSYVTNLEIAVVVTYGLFTEETPPADIPSTIKAALVSLFASFTPGEDVLYGRVIGIVYQIQGIKSITLTLNGYTSDIAVTIAQVAALSTVTVNGTVI